MESYGYRLTHDLSLDNFQSGDIYNYEECALNRLQFEKNCDAEDEISNNKLDPEDRVNEEMITLDVDYEAKEKSAIISNGWDDEAAKLLLILDEDGEKGEDEKESKDTEKDELFTEKSPSTSPSRRVRRGCGRKLPPMPVQRPDTLKLASHLGDLDADHMSPSFRSLSLEVTPSSDRSICDTLSNVPSPFVNDTMPSLLHELLPENVNSTSEQYLPFLSNTNLLLQEDSSPEEFPGSPSEKKNKRKSKTDKDSIYQDKRHPYYQPITLVIDGEVKVQTHKAIYRFIPRHEDEVALDVSDPIYVEREGADGWCEGINLRTGDEGCYPERYARIYSKETETEPGQKAQKFHLNRFRLLFLGSVETPLHKGNEVLCRAISKVITARKITHNSHAPSECILEISDHGVKMIDLSKKARSPQYPLPAA
ncbi:C-Jun-amino-terminal kinase-interacting protein 1 [Holothuria leucospilota]|uniref:C-Jun-amino-terminal kinase-interacting protein 1 n=1 Tax=Holothuria leucospilota TaxID=206669 RepID=A0A9Q1BSH3_HOLLE|nr:C-Jun-amino-terminal kinase-interacting protein 1 [Holothuria leucospilota]